MSVIRLLSAGLLAMTPAGPRPAALTTAQADAFVRDFQVVDIATGAPKMADYYTTDGTLTDPAFGLDLKGRDPIGKLLTTVLTQYASLEHEVIPTISAGDDLVVEGTMVGKRAGKTVRVRFVSVFHFTGGKISAQRDLFDALHFYAQLGIGPPEFRSKPPAEPKAPS